MESARTHLEVITAHAHKDIWESTASQVSAWWESVIKIMLSSAPKTWNPCQARENMRKQAYSGTVMVFFSPDLLQDSLFGVIH